MCVLASVVQLKKGRVSTAATAIRVTLELRAAAATETASEYEPMHLLPVAEWHNLVLVA